MKRLLEAISDLVSNAPPERIVQLADTVRSLAGSHLSAKLKTWAVTPGTRTRLNRLTASWNASVVPSGELAGMLLGANHVYQKATSESDTELVWTGPSSEIVATRKTEQALVQVINAAQEKLFLTSFVAYDVTSIMTTLAKAVERGVTLSILLESSDKHGGGVSFDGIAQMRNTLPSARVYFWKNKGKDFADGKVHAKVVVCDEKLCFVSSANLTSHAMETNMEAGVLIRGGRLPVTLHRHLESLVTMNIIQTL